MTLRNVPGLKVEVAFGTNPNDLAAVAAMTPASWTDISGRVRGVELDRPKRTAELDRFEAGTAKLTLDNFDGAFSPTNATSPYAGQLVPYRMIRTRALFPNLLSSADSQILSGVGGWLKQASSGSGSTLATSSTQVHGGSLSLKWTAGTGAASSPGAALLVDLTVGAPYLLTAWVYQPTTLGTGVYLSAGYPGTITNGTPTKTAGAWTRIELVFTPTVASCYVYVLAPDSIASGSVFYVDDVSVQLGGSLWQGYVERWPTSWTDPAQGLCDIECVDAMAVAAQIGMTSFYTSEVLADTPTYYYPLTDDSTATAAANQSTTAEPFGQIFHNSRPPTSTESYAFGSTIKISAVEPTGLGLSRGTGDAVSYPGYGLRLPTINLDWSSFTFEVWAQAESGDYGTILYLQDFAAASPPPYLHLYFDSTGKPALDILPPGGSHTGFYLSSASYTFGTPFLFAVSYDGTTLKAYINGTLMASWAPGGTTPIRSTLVQLGSSDTAGSPVAIKDADGYVGPLKGVLAQFAYYQTVLTATRLRTHWTISGGLSGQTTGYRAQSLLGYADWPSALQDIQVGGTTVQGAAAITGRSLLECLQDMADTEQGDLRTTPDGKVAFRARGARLNQYAPAATFGGNVAAGEIPVLLAGLQLDYDPTLVYNDVSIARDGASTARVYDATSILAYFPRSFSRTSYADNDQDAQDAATWLLGRYSQPSLRAETITIDAAAMGSDVPNFWATILGLDLSDRVLLNHDPMGAPLIALPGFIDQLSHTIDPDAGTWTVTIQISPLFHQYFALASATDPTWDAASTPDANGYIYLSY